MRKLAILSIFLFLGTSSLYSEIFNIGGTEINIPTPEGFSIVTEKMTGVNWLQSKMVSPDNELIASYIDNSVVDIANKGEIPIMEKTFAIQFYREFRNKTYGTDFFTNMKNLIKEQNKNTLDKIQTEISKLMKNSSKEIEKDLNIDFAMKISQMIPMAHHYDEKNIFSYSMYLKYETSAEVDKEKFAETETTTATATLINVAGKIIFLYCYGNKDDLEWTRKTSLEWAERIISLNKPSPEKTVKPGDDSFLNNHKTLIKVAFFMVFSSIMGFFYKRGKPNKSIEKNEGPGIIKK